MSSRIETIEDLMKVSGTAAAELTKSVKPKPAKPAKILKKPKPTKKIAGP